MDLNLCDLCQQAVPRDDIDRELASVHGDRTVCRSCNEAMGGNGGLPPSPGSPGHPSLGGIRVVGMPRPRFGPGVAITLSMAAILLALAAVVALMVRVENISNQWDGQFAVAALELQDLHERELGTRDYMVARAGQVAEEVLQTELARLETLERHVGELRQTLLRRSESPPGEDQPATPDPLAVDSALLTAGDAMARVKELEEQILFLQARVFELAVERDPLTHRLLYGAGGGQQAIDERPRTALARNLPGDDELIIAVVEHGLHESPGRSRADELGARLLPHQKAKCVCQHGLAGAGLPGDHVETGRQAQPCRGYQQKIIDGQLGEHLSPRLRTAPGPATEVAAVRGRGRERRQLGVGRKAPNSFSSTFR